MAIFIALIEKVLPGGNQVAMFELPVYKPRTYFNPAGFTSLGFAIPAAIGAA
ncbi:hypothetical protein JCM16161A_19850 [Vulcanisaeta sp. JCM 16161]